VHKYANLIELGRKGLATTGSESKGHIAFEEGVIGTKEAFADTATHGDIETLISAELVFLNEELRFCDTADTDAIHSATQAIASFEDALLALTTVWASHDYKIVDKSYPHTPKSRYHGMPKDAVHLACTGHRTRLTNSLRSHGVNMTEKALLKQRRANLAVIQSQYLKNQEFAL
jgi:hypothetical protein